jgi:MAF protein
MHAVTIERPLVLASASPRRRELLGLLGLVFGVRIARIEEMIRSDETALNAVQRFAREKAIAIADQMHSSSYPIVLGADTIVVLDGEPLGKPTDAQDAERTLRRLRGRDHQVYTALSLISVPERVSVDRIVCTDVPMREYSDDEIYLYVRSGDPFDKAGAYAIQNHDFRPVAELTGCYANVMGLPLCHLARELQDLGIEPRVDIPTACQKHLAYACSEYARVFAATGETE